MSSYNPTILIIRDGWGENHNPAHHPFNAIYLAKTPCADYLKKNWPRTELVTHGPAVGLPESIMGNSEVGHQNIGAGRIVDQEMVRITKEINSPDMHKNKTLCAVFDFLNKNKGKLHIIGLISDGGIHSDIEHLHSLMKLAKNKGITQVCIHAITDGRDTPPNSGKDFIKKIEKWCLDLKIGSIVSICGRYWAMDRDNRFNRTQKAYECMTGINNHSIAFSPQEALSSYYNDPVDPSLIGDEFIPPTVIVGSDKEPLGVIRPGDSVIFFNFRGDRTRQLTQAFIEEDFARWDRGQAMDIFFACMTEYQEGLTDNVLFKKPKKLTDILGDYIAQQGIPQLRCAETEKYPHVTFFFNDYRENPFALEDRILLPSPKDVPTYDYKPEMAALDIANAVKNAIFLKKYGLIVVNFANADMVGHTGNLKAAIKAVETVDIAVKIVLEAAKISNYKVLVTADHGNAEQMWEPEINTPHTRHTLNPVECIVYGKGCDAIKLRKSGQLADIAPTILELMGLKKPTAMIGSSLIEKD